MRNDIRKLICERPRTGGHGARRRKVQPADYEDAPHGESTARNRQFGYSAKEFSDYLAPLKGWLRKQVGRPWDKVYSELRAQLDRSTTLQRHVLQHVDGYVTPAAEVRMINGAPYTCGRGGWTPLTRRQGDRLVLYVNPNTGLLCVAPRWQRPKPKVDASVVWAEPDKRVYVELNGAWFEVLLAKVSRTWYPDQVYRTAENIRKGLYGPMLQKLRRADLTVVSQRALNKREIRRLGLRNQAR